MSVIGLRPLNVRFVICWGFDYARGIWVISRINHRQVESQFLTVSRKLSGRFGIDLGACSHFLYNCRLDLFHWTYKFASVDLKVSSNRANLVWQSAYFNHLDCLRYALELGVSHEIAGQSQDTEGYMSSS